MNYKIIRIIQLSRVQTCHDHGLLSKLFIVNYLMRKLSLVTDSRIAQNPEEAVMVARTDDGK
jgi:hypothetical protein